MEKRWPVTRDEMDAYVAQLDPQVKAIYQRANDLLLSLADTLDDSFQIAAAIDTVFQMYAWKRSIGR